MLLKGLIFMSLKRQYPGFNKRFGGFAGGVIYSSPLSGRPCHQGCGLGGGLRWGRPLLEASLGCGWWGLWFWSREGGSGGWVLLPGSLA